MQHQTYSKATHAKSNSIRNLGQIVREVLRPAQQPDRENIYSLKTDDLPNGVYLLNVTSAGSVTGMSKRFVIAR